MRSAMAWLCLLAAWWISSIWINNPITLPDPFQTFQTLWQLLETEKFQDHIISSVSDLTLGWVLCMLSLLLICFAMLVSDTIRNFLSDMSAGWQSTPTFAMAPIIVMSFGYNKTSVLLCLAWGMIWYAISHLSTDIIRIRNIWQGQCVNLGWSHARQFQLVYCPALLPCLALIAKNSWSMMWRTLIAIEILFGAMSGSYGLGSFMNETRQQLFVTETWSAMLVILCLGVVINKLFDAALTKIDWDKS